MASNQTSVLFVCLGNICRSPMAEAVLAHLISERGETNSWSIDSAGTGAWHIGKSPDPRTLAVCQANGIAIEHRGRQIAAADFIRFDYILAMDRANFADLDRLRPPHATAVMRLFGEFDPLGEGDVPDPYHDDLAMFHVVYAQVDRVCRAMLAHKPLISDR